MPAVALAAAAAAEDTARKSAAVVLAEALSLERKVITLPMSTSAPTISAPTITASTIKPAAVTGPAPTQVPGLVTGLGPVTGSAAARAVQLSQVSYKLFYLQIGAGRGGSDSGGRVDELRFFCDERPRIRDNLANRIGER
jgi:hypothetical protein